MKNEPVKIQIEQTEWEQYSKDKKERIKQLIKEQYGWNISSLISMDEGDEMICPYCDGEGCGVCQDEEE